MKNDVVCSLGNSIIQHGKKNNRVYLMKTTADEIPSFVVSKIDTLADENGYSKAFVKVPAGMKDEFKKNGYKTEAMIPGFFSGKTDGYFMSKYYTPEREIINNKERIEQIIGDAEDIKGTGKINNPGKDLTVRRAEKKDAAALSELYDSVFESYPFPIHEPGYIEETMDENIIYFGIWKGEKLLAASSCETDEGNLNVEMTDFAASPECRGEGYAGILLAAMEAEMKKAGYITFYTIARAAFEPVNRLFARFGYEYCGTMKNNTNICGSFESMNVWYKKAD
ncbi:MAG: putative beta-lysine N-acetyltransferase [Methanomicrobiaceae archaeon]|nr:putative beta-lysine N-acetyltransferase [Methanomicrobiaceae archaeon]